MSKRLQKIHQPWALIRMGLNILRILVAILCGLLQGQGPYTSIVMLWQSHWLVFPTN